MQFFPLLVWMNFMFSIKFRWKYALNEYGQNKGIYTARYTIFLLERNFFVKEAYSNILLNQAHRVRIVHHFLVSAVC